MSQLRSITSIGFLRIHSGARGPLARMRAGRPRSCSVFLIWEEFAAEGQLDAVAFRVGLTLDRHIEIDRAHDAVAEFLLDQLLPGRAINLNQLVEAIYQRIGRHRG